MGKIINKIEVVDQFITNLKILTTGVSTLNPKTSFKIYITEEPGE